MLEAPRASVVIYNFDKWKNLSFLTFRPCIAVFAKVALMLNILSFCDYFLLKFLHVSSF